MSVNAYLIFDGNCREAIHFYAEVFQTDPPQIMTFDESPQMPDFQIPEEVKPLVMHARLSVNGSDLMFSDNFPGTPYHVGNNITLAVVTDDESYIRSTYSKLLEGGQVTMELQETTWSKCYGSLIDKFGVQWQFSHYIQ